MTLHVVWSGSWGAAIASSRRHPSRQQSQSRDICWLSLKTFEAPNLKTDLYHFWGMNSRWPNDFAEPVSLDSLSALLQGADRVLNKERSKVLQLAANRTLKPSVPSIFETSQNSKELDGVVKNGKCF